MLLFPTTYTTSSYFKISEIYLRSRLLSTSRFHRSADRTEENFVYHLPLLLSSSLVFFLLQNQKSKKAKSKTNSQLLSSIETSSVEKIYEYILGFQRSPTPKKTTVTANQISPSIQRDRKIGTFYSSRFNFSQTQFQDFIFSVYNLIYRFNLK